MYAKSGDDLNCGQAPLDSVDPSMTSSLGQKRFAYAWYVSRTSYHCSALVALKMLKKVRLKECKVICKQSWTFYPARIVFQI
jgi:hypothetical protein